MISIEDFDYKHYLGMYNDLFSTFSTRVDAFNHLLTFGLKENRSYRKTGEIHYFNFNYERYAERINAPSSDRNTLWKHYVQSKNHEEFNETKKSIVLIHCGKDNCSTYDNFIMLLHYFNTTGYNAWGFSRHDNLDYCDLKLCDEIILVFQPPEMIEFFKKNPSLDIKPNVFWMHEFKSIPLSFKEIIQKVNQIYTSSDFCVNVFYNELGAHARKIPITSLIHQYSLDDIRDFKPSSDTMKSIQDRLATFATVFGYCFDCDSCIDRKNPVNLIKAFIKFQETSENSCCLVLKFRVRDRHDFYKLVLEMIKSHNNIILVTHELSIMELYKLYTLFDVYVSPHSGEGFGITIYDNLCLSNKILATVYSGEKEFLKENQNCVALDFEEKSLETLKNHPIYNTMSSYVCAVVSENSIFSGLRKVYSEVLRNT